MRVVLDMSEQDIVLLSALLMDDYNEMGKHLVPDEYNPDLDNFDNITCLYARDFIWGVVQKIASATHMGRG